MVGRDKHIGNYTCYTSRGKSTIDYALLSMDVFSSIDDFYIDVLDKCMSRVHCPICITISCNKTVSNENEYTRADNSDYITKKDVQYRWKDNLRDDYTSAFNIDNIQRVNSILTETLTKMASTTQNIIDYLYVNFKDIFITPAISTNMYKEIERQKNRFVKKTRQHGRKTWFSNECEVLRNECMDMKNFLTHEPSFDSYELYHIHVKKYKKCVNKTKNIYTKNYYDQIRCLKTRNPKDFCKIIMEESSIHSQDTSPIIFTDFIAHFKKLNKVPHLEESVPHLLNTSTNENINQPFSLEEVKFGINQLNVNKAGGSDIILNKFLSIVIVIVFP